jgi:hypothetical protein
VQESDDGMQRDRTGGGSSGVLRKETILEVGQVGCIGRMARTPDGSILEKKSEQGKGNWWAGKDSGPKSRVDCRKFLFKF